MMYRPTDSRHRKAYPLSYCFRGTQHGKSTFLNFLKAVFENNVTFNTNEDFRSQFNSDWAGKLLIVVDEVLLNRREDSERLKNPAPSSPTGGSQRQRPNGDCLCQVVLCSTKSPRPRRRRTRYWVRKIMPLQSDDTNFLQTSGIPAFHS